MPSISMPLTLTNGPSPFPLFKQKQLQLFIVLHYQDTDINDDTTFQMMIPVI